MTLAVGVSLPDGVAAGLPGSGAGVLAAVDAWSASMGRPPAWVNLWSSWGTAGPAPRGRDFPPVQLLDGLAARRVRPMIFWEPDLGDNHDHNARILAGELDAYLDAWGGAALAWGGPVIVRFAHEQNGSWFPWSPGKNGNTPASYLAMWRHVHDRVRGPAGSRIRFFWCPNVTGRPMSETWPGRRWVDYVGMDAYDFTNTHEPIGVRWPAQVAWLRGLSKPCLIGEMGVAAGGDPHHRADWLVRSLAGLSAAGFTGAAYFDIDMSGRGQPNWRLDASPDLRPAMRWALSTYQGGLP